MRWIESDGGPIIIMEKRLCAKWGGIDESSDRSFSSDYERACSLPDYTGILTISGGQALVLGDEPHRTSIVKNIENQTAILRWCWAPSEQAVIKAVENIEINFIKKIDTVKLNFDSKEIIMFDSSYHGSSFSNEIEFLLKPGQYKVHTEIFEPNDETRLQVHRFEHCL